MKKDEVKEIVLTFLNYLKEKMQPKQDHTIDDVIDYVNNTNNLFKDMPYESYNKLNEMFLQLNEIYKKIALESLFSYDNSNEKFHEIANLQKNHIEELKTLKNNSHIDINDIQAKFSDIQKHMVQEVTRANAEITKLKEKIKKLEEQSNIDPLTKIYNRRALDHYLQEICEKQNLKQELHLLMLDIDDFKLINDQYGHIVGDKILVFIANLLTKLLRDGDKIFRYGGEEFIIVLNRIETDACLQISERILEQIRSNNLLYKGNSLQVTASIGTTKFHAGDTPESIIDRADKALYKAKNSGKNKVETLI
jgi:diguanylate cyclase (GGDEF)-like protein